MAPSGAGVKKPPPSLAVLLPPANDKGATTPRRRHIVPTVLWHLLFLCKRITNLQTFPNMCKSEIFNRILNTVYLGPADQHNFPRQHGHLYQCLIIHSLLPHLSYLPENRQAPERLLKIPASHRCLLKYSAANLKYDNCCRPGNRQLKSHHQKRPARRLCLSSDCRNRGNTRCV